MLCALIKLARVFDAPVSVEFRNGTRWAYYEAPSESSAAMLRHDLAALGVKDCWATSGPGVVVEIPPSAADKLSKGGRP